MDSDDTACSSSEIDLIAAKLFLRLALCGGAPAPRVIDVDGHPAYASAIAELKLSGQLGRRWSLPNRALSERHHRAGPVSLHLIRINEVASQVKAPDHRSVLRQMFSDVLAWPARNSPVAILTKPHRFVQLWSYLAYH